MTEFYQSEPPRYQGLDYGPNRKLLLGVDSLAWCFEVDTSTVRRWSDKGIMPRPIKVGGRTLWKADEIRDWISNDCPQADDSAKPQKPPVSGGIND